MAGPGFVSPTPGGVPNRMNSLRARIGMLEARLALVSTPDQERRQCAVAERFDVLESHYPDSGYVRTSRGTLARYTWNVQVAGAAQRLKLGEPTGQDRAAIDAMPAAALSVLGRSTEEFVAMVGALPRLSAAELDEVSNYARGLRAAEHSSACLRAAQPSSVRAISTKTKNRCRCTSSFRQLVSRR